MQFIALFRAYVTPQYLTNTMTLEEQLSKGLASGSYHSEWEAGFI